MTKSKLTQLFQNERQVAFIELFLRTGAGQGAVACARDVATLFQGCRDIPVVPLAQAGSSVLANSQRTNKTMGTWKTN
jgi:hypothetical protein